MKHLSILLLAVAFLFSSQINAQSFDLSMLDKASSLLNAGKQAQSGELLGTAMGLLTKSANKTGGDFGSKILSQVGALDKVLPALADGTAKVGKVQKIISTVKMLYSAMQLGNMVDGGNLLGKSKALLSNVDVLKGGLGLLGEGSKVGTIAKSLDKVVKKAPKLEKSGLFANMAQKAVSKKLGSSLNILSGLL